MTLRENPIRSKNSDVKVSYDVVNLYPTVPTKEAATIILGMPAQDEILQTKTNPTIEKKLTTWLQCNCLNVTFSIWVT